MEDLVEVFEGVRIVLPSKQIEMLGPVHRFWVAGRLFKHAQGAAHFLISQGYTADEAQAYISSIPNYHRGFLVTRPIVFRDIERPQFKETMALMKVLREEEKQQEEKQERVEYVS